MAALPSLFSLEGQTALITGGTRGIGQAMALALAEAGADVVLVQRSLHNMETKTAIESLGRRASIILADLSSPDPAASITHELVNSGARIDILVNCAGVQRRHPSEQFPDTDWNEVLHVNLTTVFQLCRSIGTIMLNQTPFNARTKRRGTIINIASLLSFQGGLTVPAYAASKGGLLQLTKALSNEWAGRGVTVNAIAPGYVDTEMNTALMNDEERAKSILGRIPMGRWGLPEDFKGPVVFLASLASEYVSGECLVVDGGWMGR